MPEIAARVAYLPGQIVNIYFVGKPGSAWTLIDTGMPGSAPKIKAAAAERYGPHSRPESIILTHGHFDHIGGAQALADLWDVPIYAHPLEFPYLTGRSDYPPFDPTVGGFFPALSRFFPEKAADFSARLRALPPEGAVPGMPDWEWIFTPGHAPGHVSLFRSDDKTLIAGDAFITTNMDSFRDWVTKKQEIVRPPTYATYDWEAARRSVQYLAGLRPVTLATGHGVVMTGLSLADELEAFAGHFPIPTHGRYVPEPARVDENGVFSVPPPAPDPLPGQLAAGLGLAALAGGLAAFALNKRPQGEGE